jgi:hypothetical protein
VEEDAGELGDILNCCIPQYHRPSRLMPDRRLTITALALALALVLTLGSPVAPILQLPRIPPLTAHQTRIVIPAVEILQHAGERLGLFVRQDDPLAGRARRAGWLGAAAGGEEGRFAEDAFVGGEEALVGADAEGDDRGRCWGSASSCLVSSCG